MARLARCERHPEQLRERLGRLQEKIRGASQHHTLDLVTDDAGQRVTAPSGQKKPVDGTLATHPDVYSVSATGAPSRCARQRSPNLF